MDDVSLKRLGQVNPILADKIRELDAKFQQFYPGDYLEVVQGLRSWNQQAAIYAKGRTVLSDVGCVHSGTIHRPGTCQVHPLGAVVTNAPPGHSQHEFGLAVDVCPHLLKLQVNWAPQDPKWDYLIMFGQTIGLMSGACFHDKPHFQLTGKYPVSPNEEMRQIFAQAGMEALWKEAGLVPETSNG